MKQLEIQGQKVFALTVTEGMLESMTQNGAKWFSNGSINCFGLPMGIYTVIADSSEPEKFVKAFYANANCFFDNDYFDNKFWVEYESDDFTRVGRRKNTESDAWQSVASRIIQEYGLEGRIVLLTETA